MQVLRLKNILMVLLVLLAAILSFALFTRQRPVDFNTEVKPIFNKKCITCHGGVRRKAGFSLLFREDALANNESGKPAIVPGDPEHSEMIRRLTLKDPEERMPYRHEPLSTEEIDVLKRWIRQGAPWGAHWAYVALKPVQMPPKADWGQNEIDDFINQKLEQENLSHASRADKATLMRRVSLDLIGMPVSQHLSRQFLQDSSPRAYEDLVDSLLTSPHYGEKWASMWLDLARYADTKGYERDDSRNIWRYRDWLIHAFNDNMHYDQFLTEQIAGDLLPEPTDEQLIATAFHRNTMTNDEGGTDNEEFRTAAVLDRVNTTWEALMGTTFACVQCHSHPYDPFRHDEYYKFMAFFNDTRDEDSYGDYPLLRSYDDTSQKKLNAVIDWLQTNVSPEKAREAHLFLKTWQPSYNSLNCDSFTNSELADTKWASFRNHALCRLKHVELSHKNHIIYRFIGLVNAGKWQIHADGPQGPLLANISIDTTRGRDWKIAEADMAPIDGIHDLYFTYVNDQLKKPTESGAMLDWLFFTETFPGDGKPGQEAAKKTYWELLTAEVPTTPVMMDNPSYLHRVSHVFERGNWLVKGAVVQPDVPHSLNAFPTGAPHNRLGLAKWLVDKKNPLTSRTIVNRLWEQLFGTGLAETLEDLGTQGISPTHPELLDYLSYQLMNDYQWSLKKLLKEMVMSATYQQDSKTSTASVTKDPYDKYYERGTRVRLSAEQVRDQALVISGMLNEKMYGPSVFPFQPKGIWLSPWNGADWVMSIGDNMYRRAVYTYWKRTAAYPAMVSFDATSREVCTARRIRTNTPLQALVTLNDSSYLEMARHFAYRMQQEGGNRIEMQISKGYELALNKNISDAKLQALKKLYDGAYAKMKDDAEKTCELIGKMDGHNNPQTAALVVVANAMLNLDEIITKN